MLVNYSYFFRRYFVIIRGGKNHLMQLVVDSITIRIKNHWGMGGTRYNTTTYYSQQLTLFLYYYYYIIHHPSFLSFLSPHFSSSSSNKYIYYNVEFSFRLPDRPPSSLNKLTYILLHGSKKCKVLLSINKTYHHRENGKKESCLKL